MLWGAMSSENVGDNTVLAADFIPLIQGEYGKFQPCGKRMRYAKQALCVEKWAKADKQHTMMFSLLRGEEHHKERDDFILGLERVRESRPDLFAVDMISATYEEMTSIYCSQIREGTRKVMRPGWAGMKNPGFARIAINPTTTNRSRWEYPTTFLMRRASGLWLARIIPTMEEKVSKATWKALTDQEKRKGSGGSGIDLLGSEEGA